MLFMITQVHTPENCPKDAGGADVLVNLNAKNVTLKGRWGAWSNHTVWYLIETDSVEAIQEFVDPGMTRSVCTVMPVADRPVRR